MRSLDSPNIFPAMDLRDDKVFDGYVSEICPKNPYVESRFKINRMMGIRFYYKGNEPWIF